MEWIVRVGVVGYLAGAGACCHEDGSMVYGMDGSDSCNERMVLKKVVGHLGDSDHKYNPMALSQLAAVVARHVARS